MRLDRGREETLKKIENKDVKLIYISMRKVTSLYMAKNRG